MRILFLSNFFNHHQAPLCDELAGRCERFAFVETQAMPEERRALGYPQLSRAYVFQAKGNEAWVREGLRDSDVVIAGAAPEYWIRQRIRTGKLLLRYSERLLKNGPEPLKFLPRFLRFHWRNPAGKPIYLLCAGAYAAEDYARFGLFQGRSFKWGYFPEARRYEHPEVLLREKDPKEILWCGRFIGWKQPGTALEAARRLREEGVPFRLTFLGCGPLEAELRCLTRRLGLEDRVRFLGPQPPAQVRRVMEKAGIFLFTSDGREGWGAVLNEAMNSGCAVVASRAAGAVPYLVKQGENGWIYESGKEDGLVKALKDLLEDPSRQRLLGRAAYETVVTTWNAETAASRLTAMASCILEGRALPGWEDGPGSPAEENGAV